MPRLFIEAKSAEIKSWFDNDVFDLVDIRKFKPKNFVTGRWVLTVKRDRDGKFQKCKARWVLRGFQDRQKDAQQTHQPDQACDFFAKMQLQSGGKLCTRSRCGLSATSRSREAVVPGSTAEETSLRYE